MSFAHILNAYININLLAIAGFLSMVLYQLLAYIGRKPLRSGALLKLHYAVIVILFCLLFFYPLLPERKTSFPPVRVWSAQTKATYTSENKPDSNSVTLDFAGVSRIGSFDIDNARLAIAGFIIFLLTVGVIRFSKDLRTLFIIKGAHI